MHMVVCRVIEHYSMVAGVRQTKMCMEVDGSVVSFSCMILHLFRLVVVTPFVVQRVGALRYEGGVVLLSSSCTE